MRKLRLFIAGALKQGDIILPEPDRAHYLLNVLRLREGQAVQVFNDSGAEFEARLIAAGKHRTKLAIGEAMKKNSESSLRITLMLALSRGRGMDYAIQKAVELGVYEIMPVVTEFGSAGPAPERLQNKMAHWRRIIISASEQCGRNRLAILHEPRPPIRAGHRPQAGHPADLSPRPRGCHAGSHARGSIAGPDTRPGGRLQRRRDRACQAAALPAVGTRAEDTPRRDRRGHRHHAGATALGGFAIRAILKELKDGVIRRQVSDVQDLKHK